MHIFPRLAYDFENLAEKLEGPTSNQQDEELLANSQLFDILIEFK